ncbi:MORC family CW-type zinc finger protein 4 [Gossypium arboreum]|uniref:MORC family CW-type zinc finger protein 4 n=1 Tax=Gossypium arboreum TaxID=29729 RepID=A0A0B0N3C0_GOSAR|nr:MORC family CW-type zinc finger protein 4 [Gossypium arboreum]
MASPVNGNQIRVKTEPDVFNDKIQHTPAQQPAIDINSDSSSSSMSSGDSSGVGDSLLRFQQSSAAPEKRNSDDPLDSFPTKKRKTMFLAPLPPEPLSVQVPETVPSSLRETVGIPKGFASAVVEIRQQSKVLRGCKQFWKAGDYEGGNACDSAMSSTVGMDHVRVHPKFLHSNATSHKWALGAFAELLDNALDEACNGATYVSIDMLQNKKDGSKMLVVEDNGGGMSPDKMRQCMSLGYSSKNGNGFKTSTMRLGADVIVFSQSLGTDGKSPTRSIGVLSYTFLTETGKEDIVVPIIDFEQKGRDWTKMTRCFEDDWNRNLETIIHWSPYTSEAHLLDQFNFLKDHGTRIIIYNLWEDDEGKLELDFDTDLHDIQIRGVNRDEKNIEMAKTFHNSRHFLTYRHSLRSYASILYLRLPTNFTMILRGKDIEHHNIVNDMMLTTRITYRPQIVSGKAPISSDMVATVTIGFAKDAQHHIDIQGFNVYHKNRLIKVCWRPTLSNQLTTNRVLSELFKNCHEVGYAPRRPTKSSISKAPNFVPCVGEKSSLHPTQKEQGSISKGWNMKSGIKEKSWVPNQNGCGTPNTMDKSSSHPNLYEQVFIGGSFRTQVDKMLEQRPLVDEANQDGSSKKGESHQHPTSKTMSQISHLKAADSNCDLENLILIKLEAENQDLRERLNEMNRDLQSEKQRCETLELQFKQEQQRSEGLEKEQTALVENFAEERSRLQKEENRLRKNLRNASTTIEDLLKKVKQLEKGGVATIKKED